MKLGTGETQLLGELPQESVTPLRRASLLVVALFMGTTIPLIVFIPLMTKSPSQAMQAEPAHITVNFGDAARTSGSVAEPPDLSALSQAPADEDTLEAFVRGQELLIAKREYLTFGDTPRLYEPDFIPSVQSDEIRYQESASQLVLSDSKRERFRSDRNRYDFQGGFSYQKPARNIELGEAYLGYVQRSLSSPFSPKLQIIEGSREILKGAAMQEQIRVAR